MSSATRTRSQKRTGSSSDNPLAEPENKRAKISEPPAKQYVYIVVHDMAMAYGGGDDSGIYDANNCIKRVVNDEYSGVDKEYVTISTSDGRIRWECSDTGEGDQATLRVEKHELKGPGSEKQREWGNEEDYDDEG
ncbi:hypothetical protein ACMFMG_009095 [Clarireedia jacksonii]